MLKQAKSFASLNKSAIRLENEKKSGKKRLFKTLYRRGVGAEVTIRIKINNKITLKCNVNESLPNVRFVTAP